MILLVARDPALLVFELGVSVNAEVGSRLFPDHDVLLLALS